VDARIDSPRRDVRSARVSVRRDSTRSRGIADKRGLRAACQRGRADGGSDVCSSPGADELDVGRFCFDAQAGIRALEAPQPPAEGQGRPVRRASQTQLQPAVRHRLRRTSPVQTRVQLTLVCG
jgi:hypothetical protein